jgi:hypothetical protein
MMLKRIFFIIIICCFFSCEEKKQLSKKSLLLEIDLVAKENDSLHIFFIEKQSIDFNGNGEFWHKFKGNNKNQRISISFPENKKPLSIRIDFGSNPKNKKIILNKLKFTYFKKSFQLKGNEIYFYFNVDENNTIIDKNKGVLTRKRILEKKGPCIYPRGEKLYKKLKTIYLSKNE